MHLLHLEQAVDVSMNGNIFRNYNVVEAGQLMPGILLLIWVADDAFLNVVAHTMGSR